MEFLRQLWMPILFSGALAFVISAVCWTVLPHHKAEWQGLANEDEILAAIGKGAPRPGLYTFPFYLNPRQRESAALRAKLDRGPIGYLTIVRSGMPRMGPMMLRSLLFNVVVSFLTAYVAWHALGSGSSYLEVFRIVGTVASMAYVLGSIPESIWFGRPWRSSWLQLADGLLMGLCTAGIFGWLWPR